MTSNTQAVSTSIFIVGDPHGCFDPLLESVTEHRPDAVIILGDMTPKLPLEEVLAPILELTEVYWIPGNHDDDQADWYDNVFSSQLAGRNIHGRVIQIGKLRIAGISGVFRGDVWYPKSETETDGWPTKKEFLSCLATLARDLDGISVSSENTRYRFFRRSTRLSSAMGPIYW